MTSVDWIKLAFILPVFFGVGPLLGSIVKDKPAAQRWLFGLMVFMSVNGLFEPGNWGLTLGSVEKYRGHAKGYHFYFNHLFAIALITARWLKDPKKFRWLPPGMGWYAIFVLICSLSILNAPRADYTVMAIHKMLFFAIIAIATFNWMDRLENIQFFMKAMGMTMTLQVLVVLKMKYLDGVYQVRGTFEHQNALAMYATMIGMPMLAVALGPDFKGRRWCTVGFLACGIIVQSALSRATLVMFAGGTVMVALCSVAEKPTSRRFSMLAGVGFVGAIGLLLTLDTIVARFGDKGNDASSELREVLNAAAKDMAATHALGIGWNNYALCINTPFPYADHVYDWIRGRNMKVNTDNPNAPVESHYFLLLGENGYPGLISWLLVILVGLWRNFRGFLNFRHSFERCLCLGLMAGCSLNYVQSTLERVLTQPRNLMLWLVLFGLTGRLEVMRRALRNPVLDQPPQDASTPAGPDNPVPPQPHPVPAGLPWPAPNPLLAQAGEAPQKSARQLKFPAPSSA